MSVSLAQIHNIFVIVAICIAVSMLSVTPVHADERMAGSTEHKKTEDEKTVEINDADLSPEEFYKNHKIRIHRIESTGLYHSLKEGSLGIDLWENGDRARVSELIKTLPANTPHAYMRVLMRDLLLTGARTENLNGERFPVPGEDFLTLRLEKLIEMGAFYEAADLYRAMKDTPYHPRLLEAGVTALLYAGQTGLACLETKSYLPNFADDEFVQRANIICNHLVGDKSKLSKSESKLLSKRLVKVIKDKPYTLKPKTLATLDKLDDFELATLLADQRIDLTLIQMDKTGQRYYNLILTGDLLDTAAKKRMFYEAVKLGLKPASDLGAFYDDLSKDMDVTDAWQIKLESISEDNKIEFLYKALHDEKSNEERSKIVSALLKLQTPKEKEAYLPFAEYIKKTDPKSYDAEIYKALLSLMIAADEEIPARWVNEAKSHDSHKDTATQKIMFALPLVDTSSSIKQANYPDFSAYLRNATSRLQDIVENCYEKLDSSKYISQYDDNKNYEKIYGLTSFESYVMPRVDLMGQLTNAKRDKSMSEVLMLSHLILSKIPVQDLYAGTLSEVLEGFVEVGLTNKARILAIDAISGL